MKSDNFLQSLGISPLAENIYTQLVKKRSGSVSDLARWTGKHRPAVYRAISELISLGLASQLAQGRRISYQAESPVALFNLQKKQAEKLNELIPQYIKAFEKKDLTPKVTVLEGKQGIATAYERLMAKLERKGQIYRLESPSDYSNNKKYYPLAYWKRANSRHGDVDKFVITNKKTLDRRRKTLNRFSKAITARDGQLEQDITQLIVNDQVVFIDYKTETVIMIENARLAAHQKLLFRALFERLD